MDGQPYKAGHHAATLRRMLWREHLGLLPAQEHDASDDPNAQPPDVCPNNVMEGPEYEFVADPLSDQVWEMWCGNATRNTDMFRHLFRADPDDNSEFPLHIFKHVHAFVHLCMSCSCYCIEWRYSLTRRMQSKPLRTTKISYPRTTSSKGICMTRSCLWRKFERNSIRSRDILSGCLWIFSKTQRWPREDYR